MEEIFREIKQSMQNREDKAALVDETESYNIDTNNYYPITPWMSTKPVAFIDGGSACFIESPSLCAGFVRVISVVMKNKHTKKVLNNEFFVLARAENKNGEIYYNTTHFESKNTKKLLNNIEVNSLDPAICTSMERMSCNTMIDIARRFAELELAIDTVKELETGDMVVLDGNLKAFYKGEEEILQRLYQEAENKGVLITALAKTNNTLTEKGDTFVSVLAKNADKQEWYYYPAMEPKSPNHNADIYFVKLHRSSSYVFCLDVEKGKLPDISKVIGVLAYYSRDASFPGYPYGLIKADSLARVTENQKDILMTRFYAAEPELFESLRPYMNSINAHSVLDNMG